VAKDGRRRKKSSAVFFLTVKEKSIDSAVLSRQEAERKQNGSEMETNRSRVA
jgi:hypothetical protein